MLPFKIPVAYLHHKSRHVKFSPKGVGHSSWAVFLSIRYLITSNTSGAKPWLYDILTRTVFKLKDRRRWFRFRGIHSRFTEIEIDSCRPTILLIKRWLNKMVRKPCSLQHGKVMQYYVTSKNIRICCSFLDALLSKTLLRLDLFIQLPKATLTQLLPMPKASQLQFHLLLGWIIRHSSAKDEKKMVFSSMFPAWKRF